MVISSANRERKASQSLASELLRVRFNVRMGDRGDEPAVAHAYVPVAETRPVNDRRCQPAGDHGTTS